MFCLQMLNVALVHSARSRLLMSNILYDSCSGLSEVCIGTRYVIVWITAGSIMRVPQLCALVTKTGRGSRRLPPDGCKKYYNTILLYYDYYKIINIERTPPPSPTIVHPTPPRHTMLSDMYLYII